MYHLIFIISQILHEAKKHILSFVAFLATFFLPVLPFLIVLEACAIMEYLTRMMLNRKLKNDEHNGILSLAMMTGLAALLILISQTIMIAFEVSPSFPLPKLVASYLCGWLFKKSIKNFDSCYNINLWNYIVSFINKFSPLKKNN